MVLEYLVFSTVHHRNEFFRRRKRMYRFYHTLVKTCVHSNFLDKKWNVPEDVPFPLEILQHIRSYITDASTYWSFAKAFQIPLCQHLFCQVLAEQRWLDDGESEGTLLSIGETEYNKINNDLRYYAFLFPTSYKIVLKDNGLVLITYKKHLVPFNYETFFSTSSLLHTPYINQHNFEHNSERENAHGNHFVHTPHRLIHIYHPSDHKHMLRIVKKVPAYLKKKYLEIYKVVKCMDTKALRIEPWTKCYYETKKTWEPCQEWVDYLVQLYMFQQENSITLKQFKHRVS